MYELKVNYPAEGEIIKSEHYAINITAKDLNEVKLNINDGGWLFPKFWDGNYYYDWHPSKKGKNIITVQAKDKTGTVLKIKRICYYLDKPKNIRKK